MAYGLTMGQPARAEFIPPDERRAMIAASEASKNAEALAAPVVSAATTAPPEAAKVFPSESTPAPKVMKSEAKAAPAEEPTTFLGTMVKDGKKEYKLVQVEQKTFKPTINTNTGVKMTP